MIFVSIGAAHPLCSAAYKQANLGHLDTKITFGAIKSVLTLGIISDLEAASNSFFSKATQIYHLGFKIFTPFHINTCRCANMSA